MEREIRSLSEFSKKPVFVAGNAVGLNEIPSVIEKYNNTFHSATKMTPPQASEEANEKILYFNLQDKRQKEKPKFKLGDSVRTSDIRSVFSEGDSTNYSYWLCTKTGVRHNANPLYRIKY